MGNISWQLFLRRPSILDQVLYTNEALVTDVKLLSNFGKSDHASMEIELGVSLGKEPPETSVIKKPIGPKYL